MGDAERARAWAGTVPFSESHWWLRCMALRAMLQLPGGAERVLRWQERNAW
jgi:hypothetical protein